MKQALKKALVQMVRRLPWGARRAIIDDLLSEYNRGQILSVAIKELGISHVCATGEWGTFRSEVGDTMIIPIYGKSGTFASLTNRAFIDFFEASHGGTYLDIGANIGLTTVPIAQNPDVTCISFEPEPRNFANLAVNVQWNCKHQNVELKNVAIFDKPAVLRFELADDGNLGDHRVHLSDRPGAMREEMRSIIEVPAVRLDDSVELKRLPVAAKIDTQGAEPFVLEGGIETLSECGLLSIEFMPYMMMRLGGDPLVVVKFLRENFAKARFARGEGNAPPEERKFSSDLPISEVGSRLEAFAAKHAKDHERYLDIIATK